MTLYEINQKIMDLVDSETGELLDFDAFQQLKMDRRDKIENMALWYKDLVAQAKAIKEEADKLTERRKAAERRADSLLGYIALALNGEKFSTPRCTVSYRSSSAVNLTDEDALIEWAQTTGHEDCLNYKRPDISKRTVADLLLNGVEVPGAKIEYRKKVSVK
ncbi:MAG: siphovirus Gp157 family protein [Dysosmobacter sp.]|nr:siphovirus Gp157 family protein [Dysosmobacter sp.]